MLNHLLNVKSPDTVLTLYLTGVEVEDKWVCFKQQPANEELMLAEPCWALACSTSTDGLQTELLAASWKLQGHNMGTGHSSPFGRG